MTEIRRLIVHLDETFAVCRSELGATVRQLHEWTGGFRSSASGAPPATSVGGFGDGEEREAGSDVRLTSVESDAERPDRAREALMRCYVLVDQLVVEVGDLGDSLGGEVLPHPAEKLAARMAFVQWQINKVAAASDIPKSGTPRLKSAVRSVNELAGICSTYRPAPDRVKPIDVCHAHEAAGLDAQIAPSYRRWHLCRWCGDFRNTHGVNPPAKLVRLHDRGISMSTSLLRTAGIRPVSNRRGA